VRNCHILIFLQSKSVNNLCKLLQLLVQTIYRGYASAPHWGTSDRLGYSPRMKISGALMCAAQLSVAHAKWNAVQYQSINQPVNFWSGLSSDVTAIHATTQSAALGLHPVACNR